MSPRTTGSMRSEVKTDKSVDGGGRSMLLRAGREVFAERGYAAARTRDMLERAGATAPTLYYHFGSKAGLYLAVINAVEDDIVSAFADAIDGKDLLLDRLDAILDATVVLHAGDRAMVHLAAMMPSELRYNEDFTHENRKQAPRALRDFLRDMSATSADLAVPAEVAASAITTIMNGLGRVAHLLDDGAMRAAVDAVRVLARGSLTAPSASRP